MYGGVFKWLNHRGLYLHHNKSNCEKDESEGENVFEPAENETQDPFNDMGHIMLESTIDIDMVWKRRIMTTDQKNKPVLQA